MEYYRNNDIINKIENIFNNLFGDSDLPQAFALRFEDFRDKELNTDEWNQIIIWGEILSNLSSRIKMDMSLLEAFQNDRNMLIFCEGEIHGQIEQFESIIVLAMSKCGDITKFNDFILPRQNELVSILDRALEGRNEA